MMPLTDKESANQDQPHSPYHGQQGPSFLQEPHQKLCKSHVTSASLILRA